MEDESIELDEFEIFKSRAYSKKKVRSTRSVPVPVRPRPCSIEVRSTVSMPPRDRQTLREIGLAASQGLGDDIREDADNGHSVREEDSLLQKPAISPLRPKLDRLINSPNVSRRSLAPCRLGRSYSCKPRPTRHPANLDPKRPRINSLAGSTSEVTRHSSLTNQHGLISGTSEFEIYRVRSFSISNKGIVNRGDSFKIRSPMIRRPLLQESKEDVDTCEISNVDESVAESLFEHSDIEQDQNTEDGLPIYRVHITGASGVGKTSLTQQFMTSEYLGNMDVIPEDQGSDSRVCVQLDEEESIVEFIDENTTHGSNTDAHVIVFSVTDKSSFRYSEARLREVRTQHGQEAVVILVANKEDLVRNRTVDIDDATSLASKHGCKYTEVSAILNHKIDELLVGIVRQIRLRPQLKNRKPSSNSGQSNKQYGCIPKVLRNLFTRLLGKQNEGLTKSCENLLAI